MARRLDRETLAGLVQAGSVGGLSFEAVIRLDVYPAPQVDVSDVHRFFGLVRAGFA